MAQLHRSVVTLRVSGDSLIPDEISAALGAQPSESQTKGDRIVGPKTGKSWIVQVGMWRLDASSREPENLDAQVEEILSKLTADLTVWTEIGQRFKIDLFCGLFMASGNEGLSLSPRTVNALGQRGIELSLDIYGPIDD